MNQDEFLAKLFNLFSTTFNRGNGQAWSEAYKLVLNPDLNIDYDSLYTHVISNYSGSAAPKPAYLLEQVNKHSLFIKNKIYENEQYPVFETLIAEKNGYPYEFGIETNYTEAVKDLTQRGFHNIRFKFKR